MEIRVFASGSSGNAYLVSDEKTTLLLDAGIPLREIQVACGFKVRMIDGCLISHAHKDHSKAAEGLARLGVDIYTSAGTIEACRLTGHRINTVKTLEGITIGTFKVLPFDVQHDAPEPLGFLLESTANGERLLYFTDTYYIKYRFDRLTYIMAECNYSKEALLKSIEAGYVPIELVPRLVKSHMSLEHFIEMLKANNLTDVRQIYLLHLSDNNSDADHFREEVRRATGAEVYVC